MAGGTSTLSSVWTDYADLLGKWRVWWLMGMQDVRLRYRRSVLGPFWISLSMAGMVCGIALMYSQIFETSFATYLAFLACGFLSWNFISAMINEGCQVLVDAETMLKTASVSMPVLAARMVQRNLAIFLHNLLVIVILLLIVGVTPQVSLAFLPVGLMIVLATGFGIATILAPLCLRYRDAGQLVSSLVQVLFFVTPILWMPTQGRLSSVWIDVNPIYHLIEMIRAPLLGHMPDIKNILIAVGTAGVTLIAGWLSVAYSRRKIYIWL